MVGGAAVPDASVASAGTLWGGGAVERGRGGKRGGGRADAGGLPVMLGAVAW